MARPTPPYRNTEEHFLLSSLNEFVKVWASGNQAFMNVKCENGRATLSLGFQLGAPLSPHSYFSHQNFSPKQTRQKGPTRLARDRERAARHQEKQNTKTDTTDSVDENNPTQPCHLSAVPAENSTLSTDPPPVPQPKIPCTSAATPAAASQQSAVPAENYNPSICPPPPPLRQPSPPPAAPAVTTQADQTTTTPPSVRSSSLLFPPDPPKKDSQGTNIFLSQPAQLKPDYPYTIEALNRDFPITKQMVLKRQENLVEDKNFRPESDNMEWQIDQYAKWKGLSVSGLPLEQRPAAGDATASIGRQATTSLSEQNPTSLSAASTTATTSANQEYSPIIGKSRAVKNLNILFQPFNPSPPSSHLLHLNHSAVLLLPDEIQGKVRRRVKHETKGCDTKDEKVRTLIHRTIMEITERYGYTYNSFEKIFYT